MKRLFVLGGLLVCGAVSLAAMAFQAPAPMVVEVDKIKDNLYVLKGGGGNTSVFITGGGVIVVDTKNPGWGQPLLEKIKTLTNKPITIVINTHTHGDHVSGNVEFPATVDIVVQENTKTNMMSMRPAAGVRAACERSAAKHLPAEQREGDAEADVQGSDDHRKRAPMRSTSTTSGARTPTVMRLSCSRRCA